MEYSIKDFAKAFELWKTDFRVNPEQYFTYEEIAEMNVSEVSAERAEYFIALLNKLAKE